MPFTGTGNDFLLSQDSEVEGDAWTIKCSQILKNLMLSDRWTKNVYSSTDCIPTFTSVRPVLRDNTLNLFSRFASVIDDEKVQKPARPAADMIANPPADVGPSEISLGPLVHRTLQLRR